MTTINLKSKNQNNQKKQVSLAITHIKPKDAYLAGNVYELFNIPQKTLITEVLLKPLVAEATAGATASVGFDGGVELLNAVPIDDLTVDTAVPNIDTGSGKNVTILFSADLTDFDGLLIIGYAEYTLNTGNLLDS